MLSNEQADRILEIYEERRSRREAQIEKNRLAVHKKLPGVLSIEEEIRRLAVEEVKRRLDKSGSDGELLEQIEGLRKKKAKLLKDAGFTSDYEDVPYVCEDCKDTGYIGSRHCHCYIQLSLEMFSGSRSDGISGMRLSDFQMDFYPKDYIDEDSGKSALYLARAAKEKSAAFISHFGSSFENLLLIGRTGTGKTFLSGCIGGELAAKGHTVCYMTSFELFAVLKKEAFSRESGEGEDYHRVFSCDFLIIDDLGTELVNAMTYSQLFELINERIRCKKPTLISTNLGLNALEQNYTERVVSRFVEYYTTLKLACPDIRMQKKGIRRQ